MHTVSTNSRTVYCIGIGGIGMSALARMYYNEGYIVRGSDCVHTDLTKQLVEEGISVTYNQSGENITDDIDCVVYTVALPNDHPELVIARKKKIPIYTYPEMLGEISKNKYTIAVAGTHGKTTTTAMLAQIMRDTNLDPTVIVGSLIAITGDHKNGSNFIAGSGQYFVVEACEYKRSFTHLFPNILIITNIDEDHLDYYTNLADIQNAFRSLAVQIPKNGAVICNPHDKQVAPAVVDISASIYDYTHYGIDKQTLTVPGKHNRLNAQTAITAGVCLGIKPAIARTALSNFTGTWRRFEYIGEINDGGLLYDDYAHHPAEIETTLQAFRERFPKHRLRIIFQPHLYSRTEQLLDGFAHSLGSADEVIIASVYPAREVPEMGVGHDVLTCVTKKQNPDIPIQSFNSLDEIVEYICNTGDKHDIVVTLGAGDINTIHSHLISYEKTVV